MTNVRRIAELARLAAIRREAALTALHRVATERQAAAAAVAEIDARRTEARAVLAADPSAAMGVQADRFDRWADAERARRNMALARATAAFMDQRDEAARAHGQREVLDRLASRARAEAKAEAARRSLAAAPPAPPQR